MSYPCRMCFECMLVLFELTHVFFFFFFIFVHRVEVDMVSVFQLHTHQLKVTSSQTEHCTPLDSVVFPAFLSLSFSVVALIS